MKEFIRGIAISLVIPALFLIIQFLSLLWSRPWEVSRFITQNTSVIYVILFLAVLIAYFLTKTIKKYKSYQQVLRSYLFYLFCVLFIALPFVVKLFVIDSVFHTKVPFVAISHFYQISGSQKGCEFEETLIHDIKRGLKEFNMKHISCDEPAVKDSLEAEQLRKKKHATLLLWGKIKSVGETLKFEPHIQIAEPLGPRRVPAPSPIYDLRVCEISLDKNSIIDTIENKAKNINEIIKLIYALERYGSEDFGAAIKAFKEIDIQKPFIYLYLGNCYHFSSTPDFEKAEEAYKSGLRIDQNHLEILNNLGVLYGKTQRYEETIKTFDKALVVDSLEPLTYLNLGVLYDKMELYIPAEQEYKRVLEIDHYNRNAHLWLAWLYRHWNPPRYSDAETWYTKYLEIDSTDVGVHRGLANVYLDTEDYDKAELSLKKILDLNPDLVEAYNDLGIVYLKTDRYDKAEKEFKRALKKDPNFTRARYNLWELKKGPGKVKVFK